MGRRETEPALDDAKFKELMLLISTRLENDPTYGAIKLNKVLFYADMEHFARFGKSITGATYVKQKWGPLPKQLLPMRDQLVEENRAKIEYRKVGQHRQTRLVALAEPNLDLFTSDELRVVGEWVRLLEGVPAIVVSDVSHTLPGWRLARHGETIPYHAVFLANYPLTDEDVLWAHAVAAELGTDLQNEDVA